MKAFLSRAGWATARAEPLAGDASARSYTRLIMGTGTAILMQDPEGDVALFARLSRHLLSLGLSAPRILAEEAQAGLLLIEDLGDGVLARLAGADPAAEAPLYLLATDALLALHGHNPPPGLPVADPEKLTAMVDLAFTHYAGLPDGRAAQAALLPLLQAHAQPADVMILRDYHAENILHLPNRIGAARAGLLDFQDALRGHRAYDLVSLLRDARRDVRPETAESCILHYLRNSGLPGQAFRAALAVQGVQRNLRILGVFARLAQRGKPQYLDLLPRVWRHLQADLAHPALAPMRAPLACLPAPCPDHIERLRR